MINFILRRDFVVTSSLLIVFCGCTTVSPRSGSDKIIINEEVAPKCLKMSERKYISPPISIFNKAKSKESLLVKIKNDALQFNSDNIFIADEEESNFKELSLKIEFYNCQANEAISTEALDSACDAKNPQACFRLAARMQKEGNFSSMLLGIDRNCKLNSKKSCDWLIDLARQKEGLQKSCEAKDGSSCLAAAKIADLEKDVHSMMNFLDLGCKNSHKEACFFQHFVEEKRAKNDSDEDEKNKQYLTNISEESLRQPKLKALMSFLNSPLKE